MRPFFEPRGVMVVGASASPEKLGAVMAASLEKSGVPLARVNPRANADGFATSAAEAARQIADSGGHPDLAVICVPAGATPAALADCAAAGARAALVCSGGFSEIGPEGAAIEDRVRDELARGGMRLLGPNTSGFFAPGRGLIASFVPGAHRVAVGSVGIVAASGGVNHMLAFRLSGQGVGISLGVGIGTGVDVDHADVLAHLASDEQTRVIALHLETCDDGPALLAAVRAATARKPVVALVVGRNNVSEFARSHTGALATSWRTTRSVLSQAGAVVVDDEEQLISAVIGLSGGRIAASRSPGAALITGQAGPGLLIADELGSRRVDLPVLSEQTRQRIGELLPPLTYQANPVDTGRPGPGFSEVIAAVADDAEVDAVGVYGLTEPVLDMVSSVRRAKEMQRGSAPVIVAMDGPEEELAADRSAAVGAGVPFVTGPLGLAQAVAAVVEDARLRALDEAAVAVAGPGLEASGGWDEHAAKRLVAGLGIATPERRVVVSREEAHAAFTELRAPLAVKILSETLLHKTEVGGVHLGIADREALDAAFDALLTIGAERVLVEEMAPSGIDLILGARRDPVFGPIVLLGIGGTAAEAIGDVVIRSAPLSTEIAAAMPDELQAAALLRGWRGGPAVDTAELAACIAGIGGLLVANEWIDELEVNPLRVTAEGAIALDAVLVTRKEDDGVDTDN
ncbi:acetate--CoA ligase family protein [Leucobacter sp. CSA1]|uniref:Acetate--CoA ligase family protein n=2 Tax=Leucobacter chromiisoli TaxID=2796471 RepID=A0A934UW97_9MICO|nr:acetate--CoA ligase family protein [Leucobacter chromiisoli]